MMGTKFRSFSPLPREVSLEDHAPGHAAAPSRTCLWRGWMRKMAIPHISSATSSPPCKVWLPPVGLAPRSSYRRQVL